MKPCATYDDVNLVIKLYDLRREARLREARTWFGEHCRFSSAAEFEAACPMGSEGSTLFWQVVTYWEMVASFLTSGVLHKDLFFQSGGEMIFTWLRVEPLLGGLREAMQDSNLLCNLETASKWYIEWLSGRSPGAYEAMKDMMAG